MCGKLLFNEMPLAIYAIFVCIIVGHYRPLLCHCLVMLNGALLVCY